MPIRAVVFDIGGVLEIAPDLGTAGRWETRLGLASGEINARMSGVWRTGGVGAIHAFRFQDNAQAITEIERLLALP